MSRRAAARLEVCMAEFTFDPFSEETVKSPGPAYGELAAKCPFYHYKSPEYDFHITSNYKQIREEVLSDERVWSFKWGNAAKDWGTKDGEMNNVGFMTDPPFHLDWAAQLRRGMTPAKIRDYRPEIEAIADDLIAQMKTAEAKQGNFHDVFALPLPARTMCYMLGADQSNYPRYKHWADIFQFMLFSDPDPDAFREIVQEFQPHFMGLINDRKRILEDSGITEPTMEHLGTVLPYDYISLGLVLRVDGRRLNDAELFNICTAFLTGGQETTTSLLTNIVWRLLEEPSRWERLKAEPQLVENVIEESLRFDPPVIGHFRTSLCPVKIAGVDLPERAKLMFSMIGANRDPSLFPEPDEFKIDRPLGQVRKHVSFGYGIHFCLGAPVARLEAQVGLSRLIRHLPDLRLIGDTKRINSWLYWGRAELPVAWD
ncbi:MAG TPA: cytochrome P450 [Acetobacteraceae bacterium]|nr:cytochrome P450 [Acetobacteraceae bacterium]